MKTRIISGLVMVPLLIILYLGGWWLWAAALLIAVMGVQEFCKGWNNLDVHPSKEICYIMTVLLFVTAVPYNTGRTPVVPQYYENMMVMAIWLFLTVAIGFLYGWKIAFHLDERIPIEPLTKIRHSIGQIVDLIY